MARTVLCLECGAEIANPWSRSKWCDGCASSKAKNRHAIYRSRPEIRARARLAAERHYRAKMALLPKRPRGGQPVSFDLKVLRASYSALIKELLPKPAYLTWTSEERELRRKLREKVRNQRKTARKRAKVSGRLKTGDLLSLFDLQMGQCFYCRENLSSDYHVDHFVPLARGGTNERSNLRLACPKCNMAKSDMLPEEFLGLLAA